MNDEPADDEEDRYSKTAGPDRDHVLARGALDISQGMLEDDHKRGNGTQNLDVCAPVAIGGKTRHETSIPYFIEAVSSRR